MKTSPQGIDLIKEFEGFRPDAYQDVGGVWTIGYGFTQGVKEGDTITQEEADARLAQELLVPIENFLNRVCTVIPTQNQFDALVSLTYNIGMGNFQHSTVLADHNNRDFAGAQQAFLRWDVSNGETVPGLYNRRKKESDLYGSL
jgi:lysozyme